MFDFYKKSLSTLVFNDQLVQQDIVSSINAGMTNNIVLCGHNGSGKSYIAQLIQRELGYGDNISVSTFMAGVDKISLDILMRAMSFLGIGSANTPVFVINEADEMSKSEEAQLQWFMDNFCLGESPKARIILTTNFEKNISVRLVSRASLYQIDGPTTSQLIAPVKKELSLNNCLDGWTDDDIEDFLASLLVGGSTHHNMRTVESELEKII